MRLVERIWDDVYHPFFEIDVNTAREWYEERSQPTGVDFVHCVEIAIEKLIADPDSRSTERRALYRRGLRETRRACCKSHSFGFEPEALADILWRGSNSNYSQPAA